MGLLNGGRQQNPVSREAAIEACKPEHVQDLLGVCREPGLRQRCDEIGKSHPPVLVNGCSRFARNCSNSEELNVRASPSGIATVRKIAFSN